jgi:hypothetical protein
MSSVRCLPLRPGHLLPSFLSPRCRSQGRTAATMLPAAVARSTLPLAICGTVKSLRTPTSLSRKRAIVVASVAAAVSIALHSSSACCRTQSLGIFGASSTRDPACTTKKRTAADGWAAHDPRIWGALSQIARLALRTIEKSPQPRKTTGRLGSLPRAFVAETRNRSHQAWALLNVADSTLAMRPPVGPLAVVEPNEESAAPMSTGQN